MRHGSLFSGIGGFDLAAEWIGWENIFHCEINTFCQTVLKHHFPNSILYENIKETDFTKHRGTIDVLSGGFPCQPYSVAGKRKGKEDERHLWPEMLRAIREIQPTWVVGENVSGLINWNGGLVFDEVQTDMETEGYEVIPFILPAAGVNAPHKRDRVWFVAKNTMHGRCVQREFEQKRTKDGKQRNVSAGDSNGICGETPGITFADTNDTGNTTLQCRNNGNGTEKIKERKQSFLEFSGHIQNRWQNFPTQSPVCSRDDGIPDRLDVITFSKWRNESIKAYGNAVVPQIPFMIFQAIEKFNNQ